MKSTFCRFLTFCFFLMSSVFAEGLTDPNWVSGELENGLRYFIRQNEKPEERAELRLVVNAGSILEKEDQQGLAHYLEHSAFNGTEHFEKNEMVKFLESLGMGFGPDLNAYTSFDETVYMLTVPTGDKEVLEKAFLILSDWAGRIRNTDEALANERGVIIEEWRGRRGAQARIRDQQYPVMFAGSRYADRLPIGKLEVLQTFEFDRLRDFYRDWYRPELISVVAVGPLDVEQTREWIEQYFADLTGPEHPPERGAFEHPPHEDTQVGTFSDPELTSASVTLIWKHPPEVIRSEEDYIQDIHSSLAIDMLNQRLQELTQRGDAPFLQGGAYQGSYTRGGSVYYLYASVKDESRAYVEAARALLRESERALRHGFSEGEFNRAVSRRLRSLEQAYNERDTTESGNIAGEAVEHALTGIFVPGIERELEINRRVLPEIELEAIQSLFTTWIRDENRVIMATGPAQEDGTRLPEKEGLLAVYESIGNEEIAPYEDGVSGQPLVAEPPESGRIVDRESREDLGTRTWTLSNGVKVTLKPTDFKQDEILLEAWRVGGTQTASDEQWNTARLSASVASAMGMGTFSVVDLQKNLSGKLVDLTPYLNPDREGVTGFASPQDLETLLELIYLRFTAPRVDQEAFAALQNRLRESVRNRLADPKAEFSDLVNQSLGLHHPRTRPLELEDVDALDPEEALAFFQSRFGNAHGFHFLFTGTIDPESFAPLAEQWLGALPAVEYAINPDYFGTDYPEYYLKRQMKKGLEPVAQVRMVWTVPSFEFNYTSRHDIHSLVAALRIRLREVLREDQSGTYHVSVWPTLEHRPTPRAQLSIAFGCDPDKVEELMESVEALIKEVRTEPLEESYAQTVRETQRRRRETDMKENSFWTYILSFYDWHNEDPGVVLEFEDYVSGVSPESLLQTADWMFDTPHRADFILMPAEPVKKEETP
ncbi:MAG: insulinase family protein [Kiritimatiellia bacterium]